MSKRYTLTNFSFTVDDEIFEELKDDVEDWDELSSDEQENLIYDKVQELACEFTSIYGLNVSYYMVDELD